MNAAKRAEIFARLQAANPQPTTELNYNSPFELLIAVILSAQATDVGVNKATGPLFAVANTPEAIHALGLNKLKQYIKTIGLFNTKAANVIKTCKILMDEHGGEVPQDRASLEKLPGVGRKTANVILNTAFGEPTYRRGHPHLPGIQPHQTGHGQDGTQGGRETTESGTKGIQSRCPPLADSARPLCLRGAQTPLRGVHHRRSVRVQGQD